MTGRAPSEVTALLQDWRRGDEAALHKIIPLVYDELHRLAHVCMMGERPGHTLQTSALVNEAYLRLFDANRVDWKDRAHFLAISANVMRRVLVQFARARATRKRGGGTLKVVFDEAAVPSVDRGTDLAALDDALNVLARIDPREATVVEMRFFGGLSEKEAAEVLGVSERTVRQDWNHAKAWLLGELKREA
jgi:RNA polymerase sigma factor (TIGR02999 family)